MGKIKNSNQYQKKPVSTANKKTFDRYQPGKPGFNRK